MVCRFFRIENEIQLIASLDSLLSSTVQRGALDYTMAHFEIIDRIETNPLLIKCVKITR